MNPGRSARLIARPVWSGPRLKRNVAPAPWRCSISTRRGTPSRVPRKVSTSILSASFMLQNVAMQIQERNASTPYELIGGEEGVRALVERFYDLMELEPGFARLRAVHGSTLEHARE